MDVVFTTDVLTQGKRYAAWRDAICDRYVHVDVRATRPEDYRGFIRESHFGEVVLTDILVSEQRIRRERHHIARLDKDCYYIQLVQKGRNEVIQHGESLRSNPAQGALFCAAEPYELNCVGEMRSFYLELPRSQFADRFPHARVPLIQSFQNGYGLGRITTEFAASLASENTVLDGAARVRLGEQLMDLLALSLLADASEESSTESSVRSARLRSVKCWIEDHLDAPSLSLDQVAAANRISVRYLHVLFKASGSSVTDWIWTRRLQRCYEALVMGRYTSITDVAFDNGFASSAHFSTLFRRRYGMRPREVARPPRDKAPSGSQTPQP